MIQQTSIEAYESILDTLGSRQIEVYNMLKNLEVANNMILAKKLNWDINRVTPRVLELRKFGLIVFDSVRICPVTKRLTNFWRCK